MKNPAAVVVIALLIAVVPVIAPSPLLTPIITTVVGGGGDQARVIIKMGEGSYGFPEVMTNPEEKLEVTPNLINAGTHEADHWHVRGQFYAELFAQRFHNL